MAPASPSLTQDDAFASIRDFFGEIPLVTFGTGMSCALDVRFGMYALRDELCERISPNVLTPSQIGQWESVIEALNSGSVKGGAKTCQRGGVKVYHLG